MDEGAEAKYLGDEMGVKRGKLLGSLCDVAVPKIVERRSFEVSNSRVTGLDACQRRAGRRDTQWDSFRDSHRRF